MRGRRIVTLPAWFELPSNYKFDDFLAAPRLVVNFDESDGHGYLSEQSIQNRVAMGVPIPPQHVNPNKNPGPSPIPPKPDQPRRPLPVYTVSEVKRSPLLHGYADIGSVRVVPDDYAGEETEDNGGPVIDAKLGPDN